MEKLPDNVHSWLASCIRNSRTSELQKRLEQEASVQSGRSFPAPRMSIPPGGLSPADGRRHNSPRHLAVTAQSGEPPGRTGVSGNANRETPPWTADVIGAWPDRKSRVVQQFLSVLTPGTQAKMAALVPATQACVAMAVSLHAYDGDSADAMANECLRRLQFPSPGKALSTTEASSPRPTVSPVQLQLIFVAPESFVSLVLAKSFTCLMETISPGAFTLLPLVVISLRDGPSIASEAERLKLSIDTTTTSLASLETFIENSKTNFKAYNIKTVFVSMIEAVNSVGGLLPQRHATALHGGSYRFLWTVTRRSELLRATAGDNSVCDLVFAPSKIEDGVKMELAKVVGPVTSTTNASYNHVAPAPSVFCTPGGSAIVPVCRKVDYETQEMDGWRLPGEPQVSADIPGGLITFIARSCEIGVFQERALTTLEQSTVEGFMMTHQQTGERRLVAREWWLRWFGYNKTPLANMLSTQFPCHPRIFAVTGAPAPGDSAAGEPCGKQRWCLGCEKAFAVLDATYCLPVMVDATVAMMIKARQMWTSGQDDGAWVRNADVNRTHMCSVTCPFYS